MDISQPAWNPTDSANTAAAPDGAGEGMAPSGVNNVLRAHQGAIKRWYEWTIPKTTTGSAGAYLLAYTVPPSALTDGDSHTVEFHAANAAAATLNVGALGAFPVHYYSAGAWRLVPAGLIGVNQVLRVAYNTAAGAYRLIDLEARTGVIEAFAGATAPAGSLLCYGQAISRTDYAGIFAVLSTAHGVGDGTSTFNLPDLRGRVAAGLGNMGGTESGLLNGYVASVLGAAGGQQNESASVSGTISGNTTGQLGVSVSGNSYGNSSSFNMGSGGGSSSNIPVDGHTHSIALGGSTNPGEQLTISASLTSAASATVTNVQPTLVLNYVIRV